MQSWAKIALAVTVSVNACVAAADEYPSRPITIIVGISPGGVTDINTRLYASVVEKRLGQRIVVENRAGAGGAVAATAVQNAEPDGYTLLVFTGAQQAAVPAMQKVQFDPVNGFKPITLLFDIETFIAVPASSPVNSMRELLDWGRKKEGGLSFGSPGVGTPSHMLAARISGATKIPMRFVHYRGGSPMLTDLVAGRVDFGLPTFTVSSAFVHDKKLKLLAIDADTRSPLLPNIPTLTEAGFGNEKVARWVGLVAPAKTDDAIIQKLSREFLAAAEDIELRKRLVANGTPIHTSSPGEMLQLVKDEVERSKELVNALGLASPQ